MADRMPPRHISAAIASPDRPRGIGPDGPTDGPCIHRIRHPHLTDDKAGPRDPRGPRCVQGVLLPPGARGRPPPDPQAVLRPPGTGGVSSRSGCPLSGSISSGPSARFEFTAVPTR